MTSLGVWLMLTVFLSLALGKAGAAELGNPELLQLAASAHEENREKLHTWRGKILFLMESGSPQELLRGQPQYRKRAMITFVSDIPGRRRRCNWKDLEHFRVDNGKKKTLGLRNISTIVTRGVYYRFRSGESDQRRKMDSPTRKRLSKPSAIILSAEKAPAGQFQAEGFDPLFFFGSGAKDVAGLLRLYYERYAHGKHPGQSVVHWKRKGDEIILTTRLRGCVNRYTLSLARGGALIEYFASEPNHGRETETWKYTCSGGVWVPEEYHFQTTETPSGHSVRVSLVWVESIVNEPVDEEEFSLSKFGICRDD
ncbi:MAG: hypothetical protein GXP27_09490 [Planctomycetes bacterium]|nr:hypothetical protein [Planctomycetota bacterium]